MSAVFADTFFWIALTSVHDQAHERAKTHVRSATPSMIVTTEEVLTEYLNYFAGWGLRSKRASEQFSGSDPTSPPSAKSC